MSLNQFFALVYTVLQQVGSSELRRDLPTDARACCDLLVQRCINSLPFNSGRFQVINNSNVDKKAMIRN